MADAKPTKEVVIAGQKLLIPDPPPTVQTVQASGWTVSTTKSGMLDSSQTDAMAAAVELPDLPEMTFGRNSISFLHEATGFHLHFNAQDALALVRKEMDDIKVAASEKWMQTCNVSKIKDVVDPFDWTYTTEYRGTCNAPAEVSTTAGLDVELLRRQDPILLFDEVIFFEDELADHGASTLIGKVRVMPRCFFALIRLSVRVDGVLNRIMDTRIFHTFGTDFVVREFQARQGMVSEVTERLGPSVATPVFFADVERLLPHLERTQFITDVFTLRPAAPAP
eukprot:c32860_g1_i1.p1 GENE.c32860_g1_i1~~c32860_g1_i1.p1  ORF type:complete len:291 (-),score=54.69 c32860_g1_i1:111-950(-)